MIPALEQKSKDEIKVVQESKMQEALQYVSAHSKYYKRIFEDYNIEISKIKTLEDLQQLPVTTKDDLQTQNDDFICVPQEKIIDYVTTSGTMGAPVMMALTDKDLERLAYNEAISFACSGITSKDIIQLTTTMDRMFMAGVAYFLGARKLGAGMIRVGSGVPELQWNSILKFKPTYLICVPSFLLTLIEYAVKNSIDITRTSIKGAICIGEAIKNPDFTDNNLATRIKREWDLELFSTYASTEMATAFNECEFHQGGHLHPELLIAEILNDQNIPVKNGEEGELTITTLGVEGMPLVRFKTGDMVKGYADHCNCGRNTLRLSPVIGRKQQMIKYKGTTLYPPAMYNVLQEIKGIDAFVIEIFTNELGTDGILIKIASENTNTTFMTTIKDHFKALVKVTPMVEFVSLSKINIIKFPKMSRKPVILVDRRV